MNQVNFFLFVDVIIVIVIIIAFKASLLLKKSTFGDKIESHRSNQHLYWVGDISNKRMMRIAQRAIREIK